jgi:hypothetical protein
MGLGILGAEYVEDLAWWAVHENEERMFRHQWHHRSKQFDASIDYQSYLTQRV